MNPVFVFQKICFQIQRVACFQTSSHRPTVITECVCCYCQAFQVTATSVRFHILSFGIMYLQFKPLKAPVNANVITDNVASFNQYFVLFIQLLLLLINYFAFTELVYQLNDLFMYGVRSWFTNLSIAIAHLITMRNYLRLLIYLVTEVNSVTLHIQLFTLANYVNVGLLPVFIQLFGLLMCECWAGDVFILIA